MPRPKRPGAPEPKRRSRKGCWPCKARKVKCGEEKPACLNCQRQGDACDYSIRLNWEGRTKRKLSVGSPGSQSSSTHSAPVFSFQLGSPIQSQGIPTTSYAEGASPVVRTPEGLIWDSEYPATVPSTNPSPHTDFPELYAAAILTADPRSPPDPKATPDQFSPHVPSEGTNSIWPEHSPRSIVARDDTLSRYNLPVHNGLDGISSASPADTFSSIESVSNFRLMSSAVSQPLSFLRQTYEAPAPVFDGISPPEPTGALDRYPDWQGEDALRADLYPTHSGDDSSSQSVSHGLQTVPDVESTTTSHATSSSDDFFTKVINRPLSPNSRYPRTLQHHAATSPPNMQSVETDPPAPGSATASVAELKWHTYLTSVTDNYGLDCGRMDLDLNRNDDHASININYALDLISPQWQSAKPPSSVDKQMETTGSEPKDNLRPYYTSPVPINIPRYLSPLPSTLLHNPINLMYFHHFINHTARMMAPHDCGDNPFISVLPSMAIADSNLLNLMLAYSASHRARYLNHPEPATRIAHWVSDVFPTLRLALEKPSENITDSHFATAVMLLSLNIISPSTFEVPIPWQSYLKLARDLFLARGGDQVANPSNRIGAFLSRWLGYIDIIGSLSCRHSEPPLIDITYRCLVNANNFTLDEHSEFQIDCLTGFTPRLGLFLMRVGHLTYRCDHERFDELGQFLTDWKPAPEVLVEAETLLRDVEDIRKHAYVDMSHYEETEYQEIVTVNETFLFAGLLHLYRRVMCLPSTSVAVRQALDRLMCAWRRIRPGSPAEVGALFPLFTAGCENQDMDQRMEIMRRMRTLEATGMKQMQNARQLMQRCWDEDLPWIALAQGEFLG
ncbi:hypothetical protein ASPZODRAFT_68948 [Penicilliopsis zonata CBS 506.65]|uniref:Zn(2)-C6 fungal-type domain-containing protein n=1 Tax=Penicilliopsis zonata CBS 506.65 TaxID=1073090 RepID=A0A1L9SFA1_9EURO|nr:hypothetical protein ASPZODRAFT_68948 [Penicilliopsis zonata CBS 506.65]OJJ45876.1 hypothetical protein ASPZODRAFT_68948 [Penicilliopsis zonata CBS 506.65]